MKNIKKLLKCCKVEIFRLWEIAGGPENIIWYQGKCPKCKRFIGLTQTSKKEAEKLGYIL